MVVVSSRTIMATCSKVSDQKELEPSTTSESIHEDSVKKEIEPWLVFHNEGEIQSQEVNNETCDETSPMNPEDSENSENITSALEKYLNDEQPQNYKYNVLFTKSEFHITKHINLSLCLVNDKFCEQVFTRVILILNINARELVISDVGNFLHTLQENFMHIYYTHYNSTVYLNGCEIEIICKNVIDKWAIIRDFSISLDNQYNTVHISDTSWSKFKPFITAIETEKHVMEHISTVLNSIVNNILYKVRSKISAKCNGCKRGSKKFICCNFTSIDAYIQIYRISEISKYRTSCYIDIIRKLLDVSLRTKAESEIICFENMYKKSIN